MVLTYAYSNVEMRAVYVLYVLIMVLTKRPSTTHRHENVCILYVYVNHSSKACICIRIQKGTAVSPGPNH